MGKARTTQGKTLLPAAQWPDWTLSFGHGWPEDQAERERLMPEFRDWQARRTAWVRQHRPDLIRVMNGHVTAGGFITAAERERRRRAGIGGDMAPPALRRQ